MAHNQPTMASHKQFHQYLAKIQTQVGSSQKTFFQILTYFLELHENHPTLLSELEDLVIPNAEHITPEQFTKDLTQLQNFQKLRALALKETKNAADHPWYGFGHPDLKLDEYEPLLRMIRFTSIQLNKFWIEIQSFPIFLNILNNSSLFEVERIFRWILTHSNWPEVVVQSKIIPLLNQTESKKIFFNFIHDVNQIHSLKETLSRKINKRFLELPQMKTGFQLLNEALESIQSHELLTGTRLHLDAMIENHRNQINQIKKIQNFFYNLSIKTGMPCAKTQKEAKQICFVLKYVRQIPIKIIPFIKCINLMDSKHNIRIREWENQIRPILEMKKRLASHFNLKISITPEKLKEIAILLSEGGVLRFFQNSYQEAIQSYRQLLKNNFIESQPKKEKTHQMISKLSEWAIYLEKMRFFEKNEEIRNVFGPLFCGIDTDFDSACLANHWVMQLRMDLVSELDSFGKALIDFLLGASESNLNTLISNTSEPQFLAFEKILNEQFLSKELIDFQELIDEPQNQLIHLEKIGNVLIQLNIEPEVPFHSLEEIKALFDELVCLYQKIENNIDVKQWLKSAYRGSETDLSMIEQGVLYVQAIESAEIPETLKSTFLTIYGPQRLNEHRALVTASWSSLETLKDLLQKLELMTHRKIGGLIEIPIPILLARVHHVLKNSHLLADWIDYLKCENEIHLGQLSTILHYYEHRSLFTWEIDLVFSFAWSLSLLKYGMIRNQIIESSDSLKNLNPEFLSHLFRIDSAAHSFFEPSLQGVGPVGHT